MRDIILSDSVIIRVTIYTYSWSSCSFLNIYYFTVILDTVYCDDWWYLDYLWVGWLLLFVTFIDIDMTVILVIIIVTITVIFGIIIIIIIISINIITLITFSLTIL